MNAMVSATLLLLAGLTPALAQGQPTQNGSFAPVYLWGVGIIILGIIIAYGVMRSSRRSASERRRTDEATRELYRDEQQRSVNRN